MKRLAILLWFILPALVWGQIELPTSSPSNTVVKARCITQKPADGRIRYRWSAPTLSLVESETGKLAYLTGVSGTHTVTVTVATATADTLELEDFSAIIVFEGDAPVPPKPVPTPVTLRSLVDDEQAAQLSEFYRDFSKAVESTPPATVKQFLTVHDTMFALLGIDNPQLDAALAKRLNGMELEGLSGELLKLAGEFGDVKPVPDNPTPTITAVTYVYEKHDGPIPPAVAAALNQINRELKIRATTFDEDTTDGDGDVPEQYQVPLAAAKETGLPALVVTAGDVVVRVVKAPTTVAEILEAVR